MPKGLKRRPRGGQDAVKAVAIEVPAGQQQIVASMNAGQHSHSPSHACCSDNMHSDKMCAAYRFCRFCSADHEGGRVPVRWLLERDLRESNNVGQLT